MKNGFILHVPTRPPHKCAVPRCRQMIPVTVVMCRPHWLKVPQELRERVTFYHRPGNTVQFQEFDVAVRRAIAAI